MTDARISGNKNRRYKYNPSRTSLKKDRLSPTKKSDWSLARTRNIGKKTAATIPAFHKKTLVISLHLIIVLQHSARTP
jgi:hypothetical protein